MKPSPSPIPTATTSSSTGIVRPSSGRSTTRAGSRSRAGISTSKTSSETLRKVFEVFSAGGSCSNGYVRSYADAIDDDLLRWTPGDPDAFGAFYRRHEDAVLRYMVARVRDGELAADLTAETFAAALISAPRFRPRPEPATSWLFGIARNVLRSSARAQPRGLRSRGLGMPPLELSDADVTGIEALLSYVSARQMLEALPEEQAGALQ